jgi:hypothetical protein
MRGSAEGYGCKLRIRIAILRYLHQKAALLAALGPGRKLGNFWICLHMSQVKNSQSFSATG